MAEVMDVHTFGLSNHNNVMKNVIVFSCLFIFVCSGYSQTYTSSEAAEDIAHLKKYLKKYHPSYDRYRTKEQLDSAYAQALENLESAEITHRALAYEVSKATSAIGCGHTQVGFGKLLKMDSAVVLPLTVWIEKGSLYAREYKGVDAAVINGDRILSINGITGDSLLIMITQKIFSDGYNTSHKIKRAEQFFAYYYHHIFGNVDTFEIDIARDDKVFKTYIAAIPDPKDEPVWREHKVDTTTMLFSGGGMSLHSIPHLKETMLIKITSFGSGSQTKTRKKIFKYLKKNNIQNVVIDLRGNGGGNMFRGNKFKAYFLKKWITGITFARKPSFIMLNKNVDARLSARLTALSFMLNPLQYPSKHGWTRLFPIIKKRNSFNGQVYVLTDGNTFSMASDVASSLKNNCNAIIIGEETGGGEAGSAGMLDTKIVLPNSKIEVKFNIYWAPAVRKIVDVGSGVKPDYPIERTLQERIDRKDLDLQKAIELIQSK
jgi:Peptidase family S41